MAAVIDWTEPTVLAAPPAVGVGHARAPIEAILATIPPGAVA